MSDYNTYNTQNYEEPPQSPKTNNRVLFFVGLLALMALINGFLLYKNYNLKQNNTQQAQNIDTLTSQKAELQQLYDSTVQELEGVKTNNVNLTTELEGVRTEMEAKKEEISRILKKSNASASELTKARGLISSLTTEVNTYKQQIYELQTQNTQLKGENQNLNTQNNVLKTDVTQKTEQVATLQKAKDELETQRQELATARQQLTQQNEQLDTRVKRAEVMQALNITATGVRNRRNGKEVETDNDKRVQKLRVCFDIIQNNIAKEGEKEIMLRILNPEGTALAIQSMGSGTFKLAESGENQQYTTKANIVYTRQQKNYCMYWEQNTPFTPGNYTAEVYHEGYKIGNSAFKLK